MLQLPYRDVSDASEEPDLMVDQQESGIVGRDPFLVCFLFHNFAFICRAVPTGTIIALTLSARLRSGNTLLLTFLALAADVVLRRLRKWFVALPPIRIVAR